MLPTIQPTDTRPLASAMAILASLPHLLSHDDIAELRRFEQRLTDEITELTMDRDALRERIRNAEQ